MGLSTVQKAQIPLGRTREESEKLLDQTAAAVEASEMMDSRTLDLSGIEDVSEIVDSAVSGELLTISELCAMRRTLRVAKSLIEKLEHLAANVDCPERYFVVIITSIIVVVG
jgi:DNA mismatch repair protein MutS2